MYIHGYASTGNAKKAQILQQMFPECRLVSPTFDYNTLSPDEIQGVIRQLVEENDVNLMVGSSFGGYHALCATMFFEGPVWCINPVRDVVATISMLLNKGVDERFLAERTAGMQSAIPPHADTMIATYADFNRRVFDHLPRRNGQLNFFLSTDDEVLGSHLPLLDLFPNTNRVVWRDNAGHGFTFFSQMHDEIAATLK